MICRSPHTSSSKATIALVAAACALFQDLCPFVHGTRLALEEIAIPGIVSQSQQRRNEEIELDAEWSNGILRATGCASYTILLDTEAESENPGVAIVGQETFLFFEFTLPNNITGYDDGVDDNADDDGAEDDEDGNRRNLEEDGYLSYDSNAIFAKNWMVAFSNGALTNGCLKMEDEIEAFLDMVPGVAESSISFSDLYYGPICNSPNFTGTVLEMGVFMDENCNSYVPGLSMILNQRILSGWNSVRGDNHRFQDNDIENLYSYNSMIHKLNQELSNKDVTYCESDLDICQEVAEASVDLNSCQSLALEIMEASSSNVEFVSNENDNYGEISLNDDQEGNAGMSDYHYQMYQHVLEDYYDCISTPSDDDGCSGWSYGWGNCDSFTANDDNGNVDCEQGLCYGLLKSFETGYMLPEWLASNADILQYEMANSYKVTKPSVALLYGVLVTYIVMVAFLVAFAHWTKRILQIFSQRSGSRRMREKKTPFLAKDKSNSSLGTAGSSLGSSNTSPSRFQNSNALLQLTPTKSNLSFAPSHEMRNSERMEVIGYSRGKHDALIGFPPLDIGAI